MSKARDCHYLNESHEHYNKTKCYSFFPELVMFLDKKQKENYGSLIYSISEMTRREKNNNNKPTISLQTLLR